MNGSQVEQVVATPAPTAAAVRPGRWAYGLVVVVLVAGIVAGAVLMVRAFGAAGEALVQVVVPGQTELAFAESGAYTIFYEYQSTVGGRVYATGGADVSQLHVAVESASTGQELELTSPGADVEYNFAGRSGSAVLAFTVTEPDVYVVSGWYPPDVEGPEVVLAVGKGVGRQIVAGVLAMIAAPLLGFLLALAIGVWVWLRRRRSRRRMVGALGPGAPE